METEQNPTLRRIESLVRRSSETDRRMGYTWMIVPLLPPAAATAIGTLFIGILVSILPNIQSISQATTAPSTIEPMMGGLVALWAFGAIMLLAIFLFSALSFYYLIDRRNRHMGRQQLLFSTLHQYLASKSPGSENVAQLGYLTDDSTFAEGHRPAGLWALLVLFLSPIVGLIAAYSLTQDLRTHDELQSKYQTALTASLVDAGFQTPNFSTYKSHNRDPGLFVILTAVTGGVFWVYWFYTLLKDYNEHFTDQVRFEQQILQTLIPPPIQKNCGTCGGTVPPSAKFCPNCGSQQTG